MENVLKSLAALFMIEVYYFNKTYYLPNPDSESIPLPESKLFKIKNIKQNVVADPYVQIVDTREIDE